MSKFKKKKTEQENLAVFAHSVKKNGKWRGETTEEYKKKYSTIGFKSGTKRKERALADSTKYIHL